MLSGTIANDVATWARALTPTEVKFIGAGLTILALVGMTFLIALIETFVGRERRRKRELALARSIQSSLEQADAERDEEAEEADEEKPQIGVIAGDPGADSPCGGGGGGAVVKYFPIGPGTENALPANPQAGLQQAMQEVVDGTNFGQTLEVAYPEGQSALVGRTPKTGLGPDIVVDLANSPQERDVNIEAERVTPNPCPAIPMTRDEVERRIAEQDRILERARFREEAMAAAAIEDKELQEALALLGRDEM